MLLNNILIVAVILVLLIALYAYNRYLNVIQDRGPELTDEEEDGFDSQNIDIKYLVQEVSDAFSRKLRQSLEDDNLTKEQLKRRYKMKVELRSSLTRASYGSAKDKRVIINNIKELISASIYDINESNIETIIPFAPDKARPLDKFEILMYLYAREHKELAFMMLMDDYSLTEPVKTEDGYRYKVTKEIISDVYYDVMVNHPDDISIKNFEISFEDKKEIVAQRIYEKYIGFGPIDLLYYTVIDEIDVGVSGVMQDTFSVRSEKKNIPYSYESIWVVYHGLNLQLECIAFDSQDELIRVCDNIYKYDAPFVLSRSEGRVQSTMIDGSRILVVRPPFADSYAFFLRKFDSSPSVKPDKLIIDDNKIIPITLAKWLIKGLRNIGITGGQGTGKSTALKSFMRFIPPEYTIRLQESRFELNPRYAYPDRSIVTFQETATLSAQEGLNVQKKTNGSVNIIGEIATSIQATFLIQTAKVASLFAMFTHHAKTTKDLVEAIADNLLQERLFADKKEAVAACAEILNIDIHLRNVKGNRHLEYIHEVIPLKDIEYPSERLENGEITAIANQMDKALLDAQEYFRRSTDPKLFEVRELVRWVPHYDSEGNELRKGHFELVNLPTAETMAEIRSVLTDKEEAEFLNEMKYLQSISNGEITEEIKAWIQESLSA